MISEIEKEKIISSPKINLFFKNKISQKNKKYFSFTYILCFINIIIFICFIFFGQKGKVKVIYIEKEITENNNIQIKSFDISNINEPILPLSENDIIVKKYTKTKYDDSNIRYHFEDLYNNRKIFKINYSYLPYKKIDKSKSYLENCEKIYELTNMLNITKIDFYYNNTSTDTSDFNHIHLSMGFNQKYITLTCISLASILNTSSPDTFIHFHMVLNDVPIKDLNPLLNLKKINKNVEFIFYNGKQVDYDFKVNKNRGWRGISDYSRLLIPQIVNNTNKIIIMDCADIIANKDLSELYFFDIGDNYFVFSLEDIAGRFHEHWIFGRNNFYPNSGICLINIRKWRKDNLYRNAFYASIAYDHLPCPYQDILLMISNYKFKYWPLNYNCPQFFNNSEKDVKDYNTSAMNHWLWFQEKSPFKYSKNELIDAINNPVITHLYPTKPFWNLANDENTLKWLKYAKLAGVFDEIQSTYPNIVKRFTKNELK